MRNTWNGMESIVRFIEALIFKQIKYAKANNILAILIISASAYSPQAMAEYQYAYTGNPFTTTFTNNVLIDTPPYVYTTVDYKDEYVTVAFSTPILLTGPANLSDISSFTISVINPDFTRVLPYPYPFPSPNPNGEIGTPAHPNYIGVLDILSVDANGLPTGWNISLDYNYAAPTGRFTQSFIQTSTSQDITYGGYQGFLFYLGQLDNSPGTWTVTAVPEAETYAMMLAGLGIVGFVARRRKNKCE